MFVLLKFKRIILFLSCIIISINEIVFAQTLQVVKENVCSGAEKAEFKLLGCNSCAVIEWNDGNGFVAGNSSYSYLPTGYGFRTILVRFKTTASSGYRTLSADYWLRGDIKPKFGVDKGVFCGTSDTVTIVDSTVGAFSRLWVVENVTYNYGPQKFKYLFSSTPGYKRVFLEVTDSWGCKKSVSRDSLVSVWAPMKLYSNASAYSGCAPKSIQYFWQVDSNLQSIKTITWSFPKGTPNTFTGRAFPKIYYNSSDTFSNKLTIESKQGCKYELEKLKWILLGDTTTLLLNTNKSSYCKSDFANLTLLNARTNYAQWIVKSNAAAFNLITNEGKTVSGKFSDTTTVWIAVSENHKGCVSKAEWKTAMVSKGPVAKALGVYTNYCSVPDTIWYSNNSVLSAGNNFYRWDLFPMGNKTSAYNTNTKDFIYKVTSLKDYDLRLIVSGANGCVDTWFKSAAALGGKFNRDVKIYPSKVCPGQNIGLEALEGPGPSKNKNTIKWKIFNSSGTLISTKNGVKSTVSLTAKGKYTVRLIISNQKGCIDSVNFIDTIEIRNPQLSLKADKEFVCVNEEVKLFAAVLNKPNFYSSYWSAQNLDSPSLGTYFYYKDTIAVRFSKTGRYKLMYRYADTVGGGCTFDEEYLTRIKVSGSNYKITFDKNLGCPPLTVNIGSAQIFNVNLKSTAGPTKFLWKSAVKRPTCIFADSSKNPTTVIFKRGNHSYYLVYTNSAGCTDSTSETGVKVGVNSYFNLEVPVACAKKPSQIKNYSSDYADAYKFWCDSSYVTFSPNNTVKEPKVDFKKSGYYTIYGESKFQNCRDTFKIFVRVDRIKADFYTKDSISFCAPKLILFQNTTYLAHTNFWRFGNGDTAKSNYQNPVTAVYYQNSPVKGFDVTLISDNGWGCRDTITKKSYVKIIGPVPDMRILDTIGCEPFYARIENRSSFYSKFFLDYGDGSVADSTAIKPHPYVVGDKTKLIQVFKPKIALYDKYGCFVLAIPKDSIIVKKNAEANYSFSSGELLPKTKNTGCAPLKINFRNKSNYFQKLYWDFENKDRFDSDLPLPTYFYTKPGKYKARLVAENVNKCKDTFWGDEITVLEPPIADFSLLNDSICRKSTAYFYGNSVPKNSKIVSYNWSYGDNSTPLDTGSLPNGKWKYKWPFFQNVNLTVRDSMGCSASVLKTQFVFDTLGPEKPIIAYATVEPDNKNIRLIYLKSQAGNFQSYLDYSDTTKKSYLGSSFNINDTNKIYLAPSSVNFTNQCFTVRQKDTCDQLGKVAVSHCTMLCKTSVRNPFEIDVAWLSYVGWATELNYYEIWRNENGGIFKLIKTIDKDRSFYTDSNLCDKDYCYYIVAVHKNKLWRSRSNTSCSRAIYIPPSQPINIKLASVVNNKYNQFSFEKYYRWFPNQKYIIEHRKSRGVFTQIAAIDSLYYKDFKANVHADTNQYRVAYRDHCGVHGPWGAAATTILLKNSSGGLSTNLNWNPYTFWFSGVQKYILQSQTLSGWKNVSVFNNKRFDTSNVNLENFEIDTICLRIAAIKDTLTHDTSYSNWSCRVPDAYCWVPTAFSPNGDGINDEYKLGAAFLYNNKVGQPAEFKMTIYNRWGAIMLQTYDYKQGWDGKYLGKLCPQGIYPIEVKAVGVNGQIFYKRTYIYLHR